MAFTPNNAGIYVKQPRRWIASIGNGDASAWKFLYNGSGVGNGLAGAGVNGSKITSIQATGNDTASRIVQTALAFTTSGVTITLATPGVVSWPAFNNGYNAAVGDQVVFLNNGDTLPTGLSFNTTYFLVATFVFGTSFSLAATAGGAAIATSVSQAGTHLLALMKPIAAATVAITSGTDGVTAATDLLGLNAVPNQDNDGQKYLYLESGDLLAVSSTTTVTANKMLSVIAHGGDF
jgi:hypothetical protein